MDEIRAIKNGLGFDADVILFGSRARGDHYVDSDWDIAIVSDAFTDKDVLERRELVRDAVRDALPGESVDIVCYTPDEYKRAKDDHLPSLIEQDRADPR